jgi:hypothetical protein
VNFPLLVASILMLSASWLGVRTVFALPFDLRANWLFPIIPPEPPMALAAVRAALLTLSGVPVLVTTAAVMCPWPVRFTLEHVLLLGLAGSILADASLRGFHKIPFTCGYLPGKSKVHMVFWFGVIPLIILIHKAAELEQSALANPANYCLIAGGLAVTAVAARIAANAGVESALQFEESPAGDLVGLGL